MTWRRFKIFVLVGTGGLVAAMALQFFDNDQSRRQVYVDITIAYWFFFVYVPLAVTFMVKYGRTYIAERILDNAVGRKLYVETLDAPANMIVTVTFIAILLGMVGLGFYAGLTEQVGNSATAVPT